MKSKKEPKVFQLKLSGGDYDIEFTELRAFGIHGGFDCRLIRGFATETKKKSPIRLDSIIGHRPSIDGLSTDFVLAGSPHKGSSIDFEELKRWILLLLAASLFQEKDPSKKGFIYLLYRKDQSRAASFSWQKSETHPLISWSIATGRSLIEIRPHLIAELDSVTFEAVRQLKLPPPIGDVLDL